MTTVAYCNGVLAADTQVTDGDDLALGRNVKIGKFGETLYGASGSASYCQLFRDWCAGGFVGPAPLSKADEGRASGFTISCDIVTEYYPCGRWSKKTLSGVWADGSGGKIALGALAAGKGPVEAVEIAALYDPYTSAPITVVSL